MSWEDLLDFISSSLSENEEPCISRNASVERDEVDMFRKKPTSHSAEEFLIAPSELNLDLF
jgi:hypothetical protein